MYKYVYLFIYIYIYIYKLYLLSITYIGDFADVDGFLRINYNLYYIWDFAF